MKINTKKNNIAIAIFSFNRPNYLKEVLISLEKNIDIKDIDFYMFQDGSINKYSNRTAANQNDIDKCIVEWLISGLPNKTLINSEFNFGVGIAQYKAKTFLFDELKYDEVIFFEDDLIISKYYIRIIRLMLSIYKDNPNIGAVTCHGIGYKNTDIYEKEKKISLLTYGIPHLWGWATWKNRWDKIKPSFNKYYSYIENIDYRDRPGKKIQNFYNNEGFKKHLASSQDTGVHYAFYVNNYLILNTRVNRGQYIGIEGEHMNEKIYNSNVFFHSILEEIEYDKIITQFEEVNLEKAWNYVRKIFQK